MLVVLRDALLVVKSVGKMLELLKGYPDMTLERLAAEVGLLVSGVEKNLAQARSVAVSRLMR